MTSSHTIVSPLNGDKGQTAAACSARAKPKSNKIPVQDEEEKERESADSKKDFIREFMISLEINWGEDQ